jgi:hypothetical protein
MHDRDVTARTHKYGPSQLIETYVAVPALASLALGFGVFFLAAANVTGSSTVGAFFLLGAALVWFGATTAWLAYSPLVLDAEGVTAHKLGWKLKTIRWEDVKKIEKRRVSNWNAGYEDHFYIYDRDFRRLDMILINLCGPIFFTEAIRGFRGLLDCINAKAWRYRFPLVVRDEERARNLAVQRGSGVGERLVPKVEEVQVTEF